jgi:signal transduction histidine kinase
MSGYAWYRSLYWRIALGFVGLLAAVLLAQGLLFLWLTGRIDALPAGRTPQQLADYVARQLSEALTDTPALDLEQHVREQFSEISRPFAVVLFDGRRFSNRPGDLPEGFPGPGAPRGGPRFGGGRGGPDRPEGREPGAPQRGRRGPPNSAPIVVNGRQLGVVAVPQSPAALVALRQYGPTLAAAGLLLLLGGATAAALLIFGPIHRRLRSLDVAARALGEGHADARADERGGDEVSELARTFNRMAGDLDARTQALAAADRARRQLFADVSHELMTPLTAIRGYIETLSMPDVSLDEETQERYLRIADQETYKLEAIVGDLLDLARLEGGGEPQATERVRVDDLFRRAVDRHLPAIRASDITMRLDVHPATPAVIGNPGRLEQAVQNLAANALRHMPNGGTLTLAARPRGARVEIVVRDTGPGIAPEHLPHIFDRFYKADASRSGTRIPSGSGLGLSIVQAIVRRHGGDVAAANAEGGGAVFTLDLPAASPEA